MDTNTPPVSPAPQHEEKSVGPAVGVIIIVLVVVLGGLYFWGEHQSELKQTQMNTPAPEQTTDTSTTTTTIDTSASTSVGLPGSTQY